MDANLCITARIRSRRVLTTSVGMVNVKMNALDFVSHMPLEIVHLNTKEENVPTNGFQEKKVGIVENDFILSMFKSQESTFRLTRINGQL